MQDDYIWLISPAAAVVLRRIYKGRPTGLTHSDISRILIEIIKFYFFVLTQRTKNVYLFTLVR